MSAESAPEGEADSSTDATDKEVSCPSCDRVFDSEKGAKIHHKLTHGESLAGVQTTCELCGDSYRTPECNLERNRFCSKECLYEYRSKVNGEDHELYNRVDVDCANCGATQERFPYEIKQSENVFCDMDCKAEWWSENVTGQKHPNWVDNTSKFECEQCGEEYEYADRQADRTRFCSRECLSNWQAHNLSGENSVHWNGGYKPDYGPNWRPQRRKARKRDRYSCQVCGRDERQIGKIPSCHHITKLRHFRDKYDAPDWYERGNRLENLVLLCEQHHKEWEGIPLRPQ